MTEFNDIRFQAEQFLGYFFKFKGKELEEAFRFWANGKDLDPETEMGICQEIDRILQRKKQG